MRSTVHTSIVTIISYDCIVAAYQFSMSRTAWPEALVNSRLQQDAAALVTVSRTSCQPPNSSCKTFGRCATAAKPGRADGMGCQHT